MFSSFCSKIRYINSNNSLLTRGLKSDLHIKWVRPEKIACWHPKKTGDLVPLKNIYMPEFPLQFQNSHELKTANEYVRKVFSCDFMGRRYAMELYRQKLINEVKSNILDSTSCEVQIASMTANIRNLQNHFEIAPRDKLSRVAMKEIIDKRKKRLKYLRTWDYKKFEWLLEKLEIEYRPHPVYERVERKKSLRRLTSQWCDMVKTKKLNIYQKELDSQKVSFLEHKVETLKWARKEEIECGITPTILESEIEAAQKQLEEWQTIMNEKKKGEVV
ncbi:28S ribosomal protein S15, mitochondrial [Daktulosphaira vitifoliae]|uniref:28S ribosomal protein S15, mitochondrial n=1 Tax=Daktulosphaira vitifoliae TaxID=58002 RepID=UPI0021AA77F7|nr:28S ribosomal protein S15, mitochondrial [Daktulosphaira vitifoliae]